MQVKSKLHYLDLLWICRTVCRPACYTANRNTWSLCQHVRMHVRNDIELERRRIAGITSHSLSLAVVQGRLFSGSQPTRRSRRKTRPIQRPPVSSSAITSHCIVCGRLSSSPSSVQLLSRSFSTPLAAGCRSSAAREVNKSRERGDAGTLHTT